MTDIQLMSGLIVKRKLYVYITVRSVILVALDSLNYGFLEMENR